MTTNVTPQVDLDDDARWANWKRDGARREERQKDRIRQIVAVLCLGGAAFLLFRLV